MWIKGRRSAVEGREGGRVVLWVVAIEEQEREKKKLSVNERSCEPLERVRDGYETTDVRA